MTPLLPSACSSDRSCASTGSAPVITSSPGNATTKVLPRKACTYGATERSHSTNWAGFSMSRIIIRSDMSAPDPSKKNAARPAPHPAPPSRAVRPAAAAVNARNPLPPITFPEELPVSGRRQEIAEALKKNQVVIVSGETGSGKTTQLPKICLELGRGETGLIGHTQPRRIAASSTAKRIAQELGSPLGEHVGFKVRFTDTLSKGASVKLMTDGILLAETQTDPLLRQYDTIIIDEAHERSLNIDFLLGYLKQLLPRRRDLKVIITSATIDTARFSAHFDNAPVVDVEGRGHPVEVRYRPLEGDGDEEGERSVLAGVLAACDEIAKERPLGDTLIFLPGEREIRDAHQALERRKYRHTEVLPLYARLSARDQDRVFHPGGPR